jgi:tripartite-type tricarboxylate transporter receptor subunit TctC
MRALLPLIVGVALIAASPARAQAQDYPNRPVTLVVPYAAGGGLDVLARMLAQKLTERLGKPFVVDNRPGAGTVIGANSVAKAAPDGYTILLGTSSAFAINPTLHKSLPYDSAKDFIPVGLVSNAPFVLVVNPNEPVRSVAELIALAKSKPGQLSYGSAGPGAPSHLGMEILKSMTGMNVVHVPYRGESPALADLVAGHIQIQFAEPTPALPLLRAGKARALGLSATTRLTSAPEIAPLAEAGVPGFDFVSWQMIAAPRATPRDIVEKLHAEVGAVLALSDIKAEYARTGRIAVDYPTVDALQRYVRDEIIRLGRIVEQAGIARSQ